MFTFMFAMIFFRKFSRNIEWSMFSHLLNTGATLESNMIWSEKSFVPRTGSLNMTVDVFGRAINLFEVEGRLENFDKLLEDLFGPKEEINDIMGTNQQQQRRSKRWGISVSISVTVSLHFWNGFIRVSGKIFFMNCYLNIDLLKL